MLSLTPRFWGCLVTYPVEVRAWVLERLDEGWTARSISRWAGISRASVLEWAAAAGLMFRQGGRDGIVRVDGDFVTGQGHGRRLTSHARVAIHSWRAGGRAVAWIAAQLGVSRETVYAELRRCPAGGYRADLAESHAAALRQRRHWCRFCRHPRLTVVVAAGLADGQSPEQIAGRLKRDFPDDHTMRVSHETIYQSLYVQGKGCLLQELKREKALRSGRTSRKPRSALPARGRRSWIGEGNRLTDRPAEAEDRAVPGHWEGDLIIGTDGRTALITLAERHSRYLMAHRLPLTHDATTVGAALTSMISELPQSLRRSLAWDQGVEMAKYVQVGLDQHIQVVFCDPHSPWQRGTNENTNGLIREYFPKSTNFAHVTDAQIQDMVDQMNRRPRKTLQFATPAETLAPQLGVRLTT